MESDDHRWQEHCHGYEEPDRHSESGPAYSGSVGMSRTGKYFCGALAGFVISFLGLFGVEKSYDKNINWEREHPRVSREEVRRNGKIVAGVGGGLGLVLGGLGVRRLLSNKD